VSEARELVARQVRTSRRRTAMVNQSLGERNGTREQQITRPKARKEFSQWQGKAMTWLREKKMQGSPTRRSSRYNTANARQDEKQVGIMRQKWKTDKDGHQKHGLKSLITMGRSQGCAAMRGCHLPLNGARAQGEKVAV